MRQRTTPYKVKRWNSISKLRMAVSSLCCITLVLILTATATTAQNGSPQEQVLEQCRRTTTDSAARAACSAAAGLFNLLASNKQQSGKDLFDSLRDMPLENLLILKASDTCAFAESTAAASRQLRSSHS